MKKLTLPLIAGLLIFSKCYAGNWDHIYMGTNFGATINNYSYINLSGGGSVGGTNYPTANNKFSNQKITEGNAQVNLGIGHSYGRFYIGFNTLVQLSINTDKDFKTTKIINGKTTDVTQSIVPNAFAFGVNIQPGIVISPKLLIYSELGFILQPIDLKTTVRLTNNPQNSYSNYVDKSFLAKGLQYGIGVRYRLNNQVTIKSSFIMTSFRGSNQVLNNNPVVGNNDFHIYSSTKLKSAQTFLIGVDYDF